LNDLSLKDTLTSLYNRRYFFSHIETHVAYARRMAEDQCSITGQLAFLVIDIDFFKRVNDTLGHHGGDVVLKEVSERLSAVMRKSDVLVRWGGEEFLVVARDATLEGARQLASRVVAVVNERPFEIDKQAMGVTCSVGYCCYPFFPDVPDAVPWEKVIQFADQGLYKAKNEGRNRVVGVMAAESSGDRVDLDLLLNHFEQALGKGLARFG
jgi:diguanylate cyclase (GGDEF)-like protein